MKVDAPLLIILLCCGFLVGLMFGASIPRASVKDKSETIVTGGTLTHCDAFVTTDGDTMRQLTEAIASLPVEGGTVCWR